MIPYNSNLEKAAVIIKKNGGLTPEKLLNVIEGSEYISVDLNEDETKVVVELDETKLDTTVTENSDNLITSGAVYDAVAGKQDTLTAGTGISLTSNTVAYLGTVLYATYDSATETLSLSTTAPTEAKKTRKK